MVSKLKRRASAASNSRTFKIKNKVPEKLYSCHTALVQGYVIEGHVPADLIHRLLKERPAVAGLAVPGMPVGSPGMEGANPQPYEVISFDKAGPDFSIREKINVLSSVIQKFNRSIGSTGAKQNVQETGRTPE